jgi:hypothetical protein
MNEFEGEFITGDFDALIHEAVSKHGELLERLADGDKLDTARDRQMEIMRHVVERHDVQRYEEHQNSMLLYHALAKHAPDILNELKPKLFQSINEYDKSWSDLVRRNEQLEAALAAQVERTRVLSNERELLLRYGRAMLADMTKEGLSTIAMMQMRAVLDKESRK